MLCHSPHVPGTRTRLAVGADFQRRLPTTRAALLGEPLAPEKNASEDHEDGLISKCQAFVWL